MKRYSILGVASPYNEGHEDKWLAYPIVHHGFEAGMAKIDRLNNEVTEAEERGYSYPFVRYELIEVSNGLIGEWDERRVV